MTRLVNLPKTNKVNNLKENLAKLVMLQKNISNNNTSSVNVAFKCVCDC